MRQFVEKLAAAAPGAVDIEPLLQAGTAALAEGDTSEALAAFQQALAARPDSAEALAGLVRCLVQMGELDEAAEILQGWMRIGAAAPALREAALRWILARKSGDSNADLAPLAAAVAANPQDLQAKQDYALALFADGQQEQAMEQLLDSIRQDRDWQEGAARQQLLEFFPLSAMPARLSQRRAPPYPAYCFPDPLFLPIDSLYSQGRVRFNRPPNI